jgi:hypothetical protein
MERQVSNIILGLSGPQDRFTLKYGWFRFRLKIKPITARQLIDISGEIGQIKSIDQDKELFPEMLERTEDLKHIANSISIATGTRFRKIVARGILKLDLKDILTLFKIVKKQSDSEVFFYILISAKGMIRTIVKQEKQ